MAFIRDTKRGKNVTLNLEHLIEAGTAKNIVVQFPDAPEENPEDDMYKYKRWWIHYTPADEIAGPFKGATIRVEFSLRKRDGCGAWPNTPPVMKVLDPIWHPNVQTGSGSICHPYAYPEGGAHANGIFTCKHTLQDIIPTVLLLFTEEGIQTGTDDPLNVEAGAEVVNDYAKYCKKASTMAFEHCMDRTAEIPMHQRPIIEAEE